MNITSIGSSVTAAAASYGARNSLALPVGSDDANRSGVAPRHAHGHGGGHMRSELTSALDSIGLSVPDASAATASAVATTGSGGAVDSDGSTSAIRNDMKEFMQALAQAVQGGSPSSATPGTGGSPDAKSGFGAGLSALIGQVSSGNAPAGLQNAFAKLASDLQATQKGTAASSAAVSSVAETTDGGKPQATLQALLTQLQHNIGYANTASQSVGNLISTQV